MTFKSRLELLKLLFDKWWNQPYWYARHLRQQYDRDQWVAAFPYHSLIPRSWHDDMVRGAVLATTVPMGLWVIGYSMTDAGAADLAVAILAHGY
jgi:hypothetical protein